MKIIKNKFIAFLLLFTGLVFSCKDLTELNVNPNAAKPDDVNPNLVLPTVLTEASKTVLNLGFGNIAGVVQHTQKDAWSNEHNDYDWNNQSWSEYYAILRNNKLLYDRGVETKLEFHQGVSLVMKAMVFGLIADLWGDAPYSAALKGDEEGVENILPAFASQEAIYTGILADLEEANTLLSKDENAYEGIIKDADVIYKGDPTKWRKLANSLMLRYYMRISGKQPDIAKSGIEKIANNPSQYPIITDMGDDATMDYVGNNSGDAWPSNTVYDASGSNFRRIKMCATLVDALQVINDPRLAIWAKKVEMPLVIDATLPAETDEIIDGVRYLSPDVTGDSQVDTDPEYVGIPPSFSSLPSTYNLNPTPGQQSNNRHVSFLNDIYKQAKGDLLKARLISAAEVHFILAEAALKGWAAGDAKTHYEQAIQASLDTWEVGDDYTDYIAQPGVAYDGTLKQIIEQKWIASWTAATEAWFDYRRTGYPALKPGVAAKRQAIPVRFYYMQDELNRNANNATTAMDKLEITGFSQADGKNSAWSKPWLLQGTSKPW